MYRNVLIALAAVALIGTTVYLMDRTPKTTLQATQEISEQFHAWCQEYNVKMASPEEQQYRMKVFADNLEKINSHPHDSTYTLGQNQFMITTHEEFKAQYLTLLQRPSHVFGANLHESVEAAPSKQDWTAKGDVTAVKNQGQCGSCWAFSTTGSIESAYAVQKGEHPSLSEQQLVDCSGSFGNMGCNGGLMDYAFKYVEKNPLETEDAYPYTARDGSCKASTNGKTYGISGYTDVASGNCDSLTNAVGTSQPVSIGVDAESWQFYSGGVFSNCGTQLDHGVLAVGYDNTSSDSTDNYWLVKNSWGASWGEKGYIRLAQGNTCGICNTASYPKA